MSTSIRASGQSLPNFGRRPAHDRHVQELASLRDCGVQGFLDPHGSGCRRRPASAAPLRHPDQSVEPARRRCGLTASQLTAMSVTAATPRAKRRLQNRAKGVTWKSCGTGFARSIGRGSRFAAGGHHGAVPHDRIAVCSSASTLERTAARRTAASNRRRFSVRRVS